ncbi:MAG TPA: metallophosphoesterase, partial [Candidatus Ozemobacteraceae bacterium]|nr:metallophosphoesterase [Candidatus Ozemobacteraceae bacterium]
RTFQPLTVSVTTRLRFSLLHTNDLHSLVEGLGPDRCLDFSPGSADPVRGHYARLATLIRTSRRERESRSSSVFLVDAGDAEFGSLFHLIGPNPATEDMPEYRFFHDLEYDLLGMGNHFFESGAHGLENAWAKVERGGWRLPFLVSNATFTDQAGLVARRFVAQPLTQPTTGFHRLAIREVVADGQTLRIGFLGLVGPYAAKCSLANRSDLRFIGFDDDSGRECPQELHAQARALVRELRDVHRVEVVVAIFHGGHPEDHALAKAVPEIDVIVAGHTHAVYAETVGRTIVAQAGYGGTTLGCLDFVWQDGHLTWENPDASLLPVTSAVPADPDILARVEAGRREVNRLLNGSSFAYETPVFALDHDLPRRRFPDNAAGVFAVSGILDELNRRIIPAADLFVSSYGLVRSEFLCVAGRATVFQYSDIFKFFPLGFGRDLRAGTPVHVFSLTRADLKSLLEAMAALCLLFPVFEPVVSSSLSFRIAWWGIPF